jgi:hypothetical protein
MENVKTEFMYSLKELRKPKETSLVMMVRAITSQNHVVLYFNCIGFSQHNYLHRTAKLQKQQI